MGRKDKGYPFQRKQVLQLETSRRGLGYKAETSGQSIVSQYNVSSDEEDGQGYETSGPYKQNLIAFQKSSQTVGGYSHEQVEVRNDEEKNDNKIKEKSKVKSESSESVLDDKLKDFLAEIETMPFDNDKQPGESKQNSDMEGGKDELIFKITSGERSVDVTEDEEEIPPPPAAPTCSWQQCQDEGSSFFYYWNIVTNETTWEIPPEFSQYILLMREYEIELNAYKKLIAERGVKVKKRKPKPDQKSSSSKDSSAKSEQSATVKKPLKPVPIESHSSRITSDISATKPKVSNKIAETVASNLATHSEKHVKTSATLATVNASTKLPTKTVTPSVPIGRTGSALGSLFAAYSADEGELSNSFGESPVKSASSDKTGRTSDEGSNDMETDKVKDHGLSHEVEESSVMFYGPQLPEAFSTKTHDIVGNSGFGLTSEGDDDDVDLDIETELDLALEKKKTLQHPTNSHSGFFKDNSNRSGNQPILEQISHINDDYKDKKPRLNCDEVVTTMRKRSSSKGDFDAPFDMKRPKMEPVDRITTSDKLENKEYRSNGSKIDGHFGISDGPSEMDNCSFESNVIDIRARIAQLEEVKDIASLVLDKLAFFETTKQSISKLQVLLIETQTRIQDWREGGLTTDHLLRKLNESHLSVMRYEKDATPEGWTCHWDKHYQRYYYSNDLLGTWQWDYPTVGEDPLPIIDGLQTDNSNLQTFTPSVFPVSMLTQPPPPPPPINELASETSGSEMQQEEASFAADDNLLPLGDIPEESNDPSPDGLIDNYVEPNSGAEEILINSGTIENCENQSVSHMADMEECLHERCIEESSSNDLVAVNASVAFQNPEEAVMDSGNFYIAKSETDVVEDPQPIASTIHAIDGSPDVTKVEKKKKKKTKDHSVSSGLGLKKMPSMVQKWQKVRKELEEALQKDAKDLEESKI